MSGCTRTEVPGSGFTVHVDDLAVRVVAVAEGARLTVSGQLACADAVAMYFDSLTSEELQLLPAGLDAPQTSALVHVDMHTAEAVCVPYEPERLAAAFADVLATVGMTAPVTASAQPSTAQR